MGKVLEFDNLSTIEDKWAIIEKHIFEKGSEDYNIDVIVMGTTLHIPLNADTYNLLSSFVKNITADMLPGISFVSLNNLNDPNGLNDLNDLTSGLGAILYTIKPREVK